MSLLKSPSIFVHIAAYRDPEVLPTLRDLYARAEHPDHIYVGVCWQYNPLKGEEPLKAALQSEQVRFVNYLASQSQGVGWARYEAQKLYKDEAFVLQIDCHTRFSQHWDSFLLSQWQQCGDERAVLSCTPAAYDQTNGTLKKAVANTLYPKCFKENGLLELKTVFLKESLEKPVDAVFASPKFIFAPAQMLADVPSDPMVYFSEEGVSYSIRLWSYSWNVYIPTYPPVYHSFNTTGKQRSLHWQDNSDWAMLQKRALHRYSALLAEADTQDESAFGLGKARSLQDFTEFCGIDLRKQQLNLQTLPNLNANQALAAPKIPATPKTPATPAALEIHEDSWPASAGLEQGDFIPFFRLYDQDGYLREIHTYAGLWTILVCLPTAEKLLLNDLKAAWHSLRFHNLQVVAIAPQPPAALKQLQEMYQLPFTLWSDPTGRVSQVLGTCHAKQKTIETAEAVKTAETAEPRGYLLTPNLRIQKKFALDTLSASIGQILADNLPPAAPMPGPVVTMHAPVLIVPNVLTSEQCQLLMQQWHQGNQFEGKVGAGSQTRAQKLAKVRTDILLQKPMMAEVDRALGGTLFPEIEKVFGLKVTHREEYKIGCYDAAKGGFFKQHRDNFDRHLSHRRVAMTMNLNDDYGGGGLNFPEYGNFVYRPAAGGAVIFPCSLMHQALPVTSGKRFMMVSFFFGEAEVSHRLEFVADAEKYYAASKRHLLAPSKIELQGQDNIRARYSFDQS
ncbi:MAG: redoxin domain-containing protein [Leptolyngbyaceae cyanobacterium RM1_1_2]|nr:redoxin domain-containing protein [Leptolyngbyaceae cyanobacterium RM1_1_2]